MIACSHPGKLGDCIYSLPTVKKLCSLLNTGCDFYTSGYCKPLKRLIEYQSYINKFIISNEYKIIRDDIGIQPWVMPIDESLYDEIFQLGYKRVPDRPLHEFISRSVNLNIDLNLEYQYPEFETLNEPYLVLAPKGKITFDPLFINFVKKSPIQVVIIGGHNDYIGVGIDKTGLDFLETTTWIAKSKGFVGLMSSQLALANGFNIPKIVVYDKRSWDMRHAIKSNNNHYLLNPTVEEMIERL